MLGEDLRALGLAVLLAHIDDAHDGHALVVHARGHVEQGVLAALDVVEALHRRRGGAEDDDGAFHLCAHDGDIARVVAGGFLLLVGVLVFLIHNDESKRINGRKDGGARPDDDAGAALPYLVPFIMALARGEMAVQHGDERLQRAGAEAGLEAFDGLRREGNLRHEHDGALPLPQRVRNGLEVYLRLARAGDAVQEEGGGKRVSG